MWLPRYLWTGEVHSSFGAHSSWKRLLSLRSALPLKNMHICGLFFAFFATWHEEEFVLFPAYPLFKTGFLQIGVFYVDPLTAFRRASRAPQQRNVSWCGTLLDYPSFMDNSGELWTPTTLWSPHPSHPGVCEAQLLVLWVKISPGAELY